jgi:hypothetical protein
MATRKGAFWRLTLAVSVLALITGMSTTAANAATSARATVTQSNPTFMGMPTHLVNGHYTTIDCDDIYIYRTSAYLTVGDNLGDSADFETYTTCFDFTLERADGLYGYDWWEIINNANGDCLGWDEDAGEIVAQTCSTGIATFQWWADPGDGISGSTYWSNYWYSVFEGASAPGLVIWDVSGGSCDTNSPASVGPPSAVTCDHLVRVSG